jgi:hypothetical protein
MGNNVMNRLTGCSPPAMIAQMAQARAFVTPHWMEAQRTEDLAHQERICD